MIASREREGKQVSPFPKEKSSINRRFYVLRSSVEKPDRNDDDVGKFSFSCCDMSSL